MQCTCGSPTRSWNCASRSRTWWSGALSCVHVYDDWRAGVDGPHDLGRLCRFLEEQAGHESGAAEADPRGPAAALDQLTRARARRRSGNSASPGAGGKQAAARLGFESRAQGDSAGGTWAAQHWPSACASPIGAGKSVTRKMRLAADAAGSQGRPDSSSTHSDDSGLEALLPKAEMARDLDALRMHMNDPVLGNPVLCVQRQLGSSIVFQRSVRHLGLRPTSGNTAAYCRLQVSEGWTGVSLWARATTRVPDRKRDLLS
jgi:hypothetical protein